MAKVITTELQHSGASAANITLDSSKNVTCENNLQVDGNVTVTGTLPADKLTGNLPAISGANLTGIPTRTQPFRNLIINGACNVAQRGTSKSTHTGHGYFTVDRFYTTIGGEDEGRTENQITLTSGDSGPWAKGFRKAFQITNGNQSSGAGADDNLWMIYKVEAQDMASCGWDYTSTSSYITCSFWVKSSVAQNFYGYFKVPDSNHYYSFETGSLSANTWTKITKTLPGNSNLVINNDTGDGFQFNLDLFRGTTWTGTRTLNTWSAWDANVRTPNQTSTWWTTNDATFAITGLQVEVGSTATEFEHRSYGDELARCHRYYWEITQNFYAYQYSSGYKMGDIYHPQPMRATPTETLTVGDGSFTHYNETIYKFMAYVSSNTSDASAKYWTKVVFDAEL